MKTIFTKYRIILAVNAILIAYVLINGNLLFQDIIFLFLVFLIPGLIFSNLEYLFKRNNNYFQFLKDKLFPSFFILIFIFGLAIYSTTTRYIRKDKAVEDIEFMKQSLENIHPDIYHEISRDSFLVQYNQIINNLPIEISETDFYKTCARLTSFFGNGHTRPTENVLGKRMQFLFKRIFPYKVEILDNKLFVSSNLLLFNRIPKGAEIIEINGRKVNQLITEWSRLVSYESDAYRDYLITKPINIGIWNDFKSYQIKYIDPVSNRPKQINSIGGVLSNMYSFLSERKQKPPKLFFRQISPDIAYIGFFDCHDLKNYEKFFQSVFSKMKSTQTGHLIIDIRGNGGGHTRIGAELMQYIFNQPFREADSIRVKVSRELIATGKVDEQLKPDQKVVGQTYTLISEPYPLRENPIRFTGKTWLLTDHATFSAAQVFASSYKCYGNGTIIGEETGGVTVSFGDVHFFTLPNTGLTLMTSWKEAFSACGKDDKHGVLPDYSIKSNKALEFTIDLIYNRVKIDR